MASLTPKEAYLWAGLLAVLPPQSPTHSSPSSTLPLCPAVSQEWADPLALALLPRPDLHLTSHTQFHTSSLQKRTSELARWLSSRPEKIIVMVGHCSFWHDFRGRTEKRMNNCEMRTMRW